MASLDWSKCPAVESIPGKRSGAWWRCWNSRPAVWTLRPPHTYPRKRSMRILFDHGTPAPLISFLEGYTVTKAKDMGWERLVNGELLKAAEEAGCEVLLTTDKNMASQRNLKTRRIAIVVLGNSQWRIVQRYVRKIAAAVDAATTGSFDEVDIPFS